MSEIPKKLEQAIRAIRELPPRPQLEAQLRIFEGAISRINYLERELGRRPVLRDAYLQAAIQGVLASEWSAGRPHEDIVNRARNVVAIAMENRDLVDVWETGS